MKLIIIIIVLSLLILQAPEAFAQGYIRRLKGISDGMNYMDQERQQEGRNYKRAEEFVIGPDIAVGLSKDDIVKTCGEPVAIASGGTRWVYKPPTSTFFKGEKIYLFFNKDDQLIDWEKVSQK